MSPVAWSAPALRAVSGARSLRHCDEINVSVWVRPRDRSVPDALPTEAPLSMISQGQSIYTDLVCKDRMSGSSQTAKCHCREPERPGLPVLERLASTRATSMWRPRERCADGFRDL